jgi:plasmid maintenance system antidote protein VapI
MLARMKTLHTDKTAEITIIIPQESASKVTDAITALFNFAGYEVEKEIDENRQYSIEEAFPNFCPAAVLQGARLRNELTQVELAEKLNIRQNHVSEMEAGKRPISRKMAVKLEKVLNLPAKAFITV